MATTRATSFSAPGDWHQSGGSRRDPVSAFSAGPPSADDSDGPHHGQPAGKPPVIPHAAPIVDAEGRLTYVGSDGLRYVVAEPPQQQ